MRPRLLACHLLPSQPCLKTMHPCACSYASCNVSGLESCSLAGRQTSTGTPGVDFATNNPAKVKTQVCYGTSATTLTSFVAAETEVRCRGLFLGALLGGSDSRQCTPSLCVLVFELH